MIRLHWYNKNGNVGDALPPYICTRALSEHVEYAGIEDAQLLAIGSMMYVVTPAYHGAIWGTGTLDYRHCDVSTKKIFLLRGKLTCELAGVTVPCADPGLLLSRYFQPDRPVRFELGIIPHFSEKSCLAALRVSESPDVLLINPLQGVEDYTRQVCMCKRILSSSLHGLVVADSYGIPNAWGRFGNGTGLSPHKFLDYFSVSDRPGQLIIPTPTDGLQDVLPRITYRMPPELLRGLQGLILGHLPVL